MADNEQPGGPMEDLVRRHATRHAAPPGLAARISAVLAAAALEEGRADVPNRVAALRPAARFRPLALAASFLLAIVLSSGATWYVTASHGQDRLAREVVASHVRSMLGAHLTDVASSDQHTVKPWFDGKLDLSPPVVDLAGQGFPLVGGRLVYIDQHPAAALVYRYNQHVINVFVWRGDSAAIAPKPPAALQGYNLRHWQDGDMTFWAVSDVNGAELDVFVKGIKSASR